MPKQNQNILHMPPFSRPQSIAISNQLSMSKFRPLVLLLDFIRRFTFALQSSHNNNDNNKYENVAVTKAQRLVKVLSIKFWQRPLNVG